MDADQLKHVVEAALLAAGRPMDLNDLRALFGDEHAPSKDDLRSALAALDADYAGRGIAVHEVASGFRIQVRPSFAPWLGKLWEERAPRYSRALLETLAIIAYRQPVTRGDVEEIRGVGVTTNIMRTLLERNWIRVVGFRDVPGKPAMYGTTRDFLDYFGLKKLDDLPPLGELRDLDSMSAQLDFDPAVAASAAAGDEAGEPSEAGAEPDSPEGDDAALATVTPITEAADRQSGAHDDADATPEPTPDNVIPIKAR
jgi:segregation and condensation protein B